MRRARAATNVSRDRHHAAKTEGKKHHRRTEAQTECDRFRIFVSVTSTQNDIDAPRLSDATLSLLTTEDTVEAIEVFETAMERMRKKVKQLRHRNAAAPFELVNER
jgi:hypothetical protein